MAISKIAMGVMVVNLSAGWFSTLALITLVGCGSSSGFPKTYKVVGTVKLNGTPIDGAMVTFLSSEGKKNAVGSTNAKGEFKLSTFGPSDGALPGAYKVTISKIDRPAAPAPSTPAPGVIASGEISESYVPPTNSEGSPKRDSAPKNLLPVKYASDQTSGLIATVAENDQNKFDFEL